MTERPILNVESPKTQAIASVKALLAWKGRASDPLPEFVELGKEEGRLVLVLSNKKDAYYVVTARDCSCPAAIYRHNGPCKHQRKYFPEIKAATKPTDIIMERKPFRPFIEDETKGPVEASSIPLIDTLGEPNPGELAYHSIREDKVMWPMEA